MRVCSPPLPLPLPLPRSLEVLELVVESVEDESLPSLPAYEVELVDEALSSPPSESVDEDLLVDVATELEDGAVVIVD